MHGNTKEARAKSSRQRESFGSIALPFRGDLEMQTIFF